MKRTDIHQCKSCPWRVSCVPERDIPNYDRDLAKGLRNTLVSGEDSLRPVLAGDTMRIMACHYSEPGDEFPCAGWLHHQIGRGNNIGARIMVMTGRMPMPHVTGEQHERYEDTLRATCQGDRDG